MAIGKRSGESVMCYASASCRRFPAATRFPSRVKTMWHLIEDFFEQGIVVKLFLGVGWLAVIIMLASFVSLLMP